MENKAFINLEEYLELRDCKNELDKLHDNLYHTFHTVDEAEYFEDPIVGRIRCENRKEIHVSKKKLEKFLNTYVNREGFKLVIEEGEE